MQISPQAREILRRMGLKRILVDPQSQGWRLEVAAAVEPAEREALAGELRDAVPALAEVRVVVSAEALLGGLRRELGAQLLAGAQLSPMDEGGFRLQVSAEQQARLAEAETADRLGRVWLALAGDAPLSVEARPDQPPPPAAQEEARRFARAHTRERSEESRVEVLAGRSFRERPVPLAEAGAPRERLAVRGRVFRVERRETRRGGELLLLELADDTDALRVRFLARRGRAPQITAGDFLALRGRLELDEGGEPVLAAQDVTRLSCEGRRDEAAEQRVELHLHTRMSPMDSVVGVEEAVRLAAAFGHPALAVTDHGGVQAFPEAYAAGRRHGVRVILGLEAYLVDDLAPLVRRPRSRPLVEESFVVVDVETTGLSAVGHELLELGAVRWEGGRVQDTLHRFVRPGRDIPPEVAALTGITPEMLQDAPPAEAVLREFREFAGDAVLAAHNAPFDLGFLGTAGERLLGWRPEQPVLDTLLLSRAVLPHLKSHRLGAVARALEVPQEREHRALDDALTTAQVLGRLLERAGCHDAAQLNELGRRIAPTALHPYHAVVLVRDQEGLEELYRLVTRSHLEHFHRVPRVLKSELGSRRAHFLIGSGCAAGEVYQAVLRGADPEELASLAEFYDYLEVHPPAVHAHLVERGVVTEEELRQVVARIVELGRRTGRPVVATGDVHHLEPGEREFRRVLQAAQGGEAEGDGGCHLRTTQEMLEELSFLGEDTARQVVVDAPRRVAAQVAEVSPVPDGIFAPELEGAVEEIRRTAQEEARRRYGDPLPPLVATRLTRELEAVLGHGYAGIYLIARQLVLRSQAEGFLVGSRGSVGSSLVATLCGITEVNPLPPHYRCPSCRHTRFVEEAGAGSGFDLPPAPCPECGTPLERDGHDIPFETFLGFAGDKVPDIDLNFSGRCQGLIHRYAEELLGKDCVFRAGTIATVAERTAYGLAKGYLERAGRPFREARVSQLAAGVTGVRRTTGQHPGGLMVVPRSLDVHRFTPLQHPANDRTTGTITTHFDYHAISSRLLKLDLLGHDDPTVMRLLQDYTGVAPRAVPCDDPDTLALFSGLGGLGVKAADIGTEVGTLGIPEFGTRFVRQMLTEAKPRAFSELVRISGLSHGTDVWAGNAQDLVRAGKSLSEVIATRDDIMTYLLRRGVEPARAFQIMERVRKGRGLEPEDEAEMRGKAVPEWYLESCRKIKYMFPKAHAVAYVMMAVRIAYYKLHHPKAFYAAYFSIHGDEVDAGVLCRGGQAVAARLREIEEKGNEASPKERGLVPALEVAREAWARGVRFLPVDLARSAAEDFQVTEAGLLPPFVALPGLGLAAARSIVEAREADPFDSLRDLKTRAKVSKTVIELLERHGCLRDLPATEQLTLF